MKRVTVVDPFAPVRRTQQATQPIQPKVVSRPQPKTEPPAAKQATRFSRLRAFRLGHKWQIVIITLAAAVAGLLMTIPGAGEFVIGVYAIIAILFKIKSKTTMTLSGLMFIFVVVLLIVEPSKVLAMAFATYAFLMLVIGLITLVIELRNAPLQPIKPGLTLHKDE